MKVLLALHDESVYMVFNMFAQMSNVETSKPQRMTTESAVEALLANNPDRVLVDVNLGTRGGLDYTPFLKIEEAMREKGYDTQTSLLGITGRIDLIQEIREKHSNLRVAEKPNDNEMVYAFLKGN